MLASRVAYPPQPDCALRNFYVAMQYKLIYMRGRSQTRHLRSGIADRTSIPDRDDVAADPGAQEPATKRIIAMSDVSETITPSKSKSKSANGGVQTPKFEIPRFELPQFEMPKMEVPAVFREFAEKSVSQAKENWEKMKSATEEATDVIETSYATASKGCADYGLKLIEAARTNMNAAFDYTTELLKTKSASEAIELSTGHMRKQFDALSEQSKELAALAQKVATESAEPIKEGMTSAFKKVA